MQAWWLPISFLFKLYSFVYSVVIMIFAEVMYQGMISMCKGLELTCYM